MGIMGIKKRILSVLLTLALVLSLVSFTACFEGIDDILTGSEVTTPVPEETTEPTPAEPERNAPLLWKVTCPDGNSIHISARFMLRKSRFIRLTAL